jgi:hypothetical protein
MQRVGAQYLVKKFADQILAPPEQAPAEQSSEVEAVQTVPLNDVASLDGQIILNEEGRRLGIARQLVEVKIYVVSQTAHNLPGQLQDCLADPETEVMFHYDDGRLTGIIYVPASARGAGNVAGTRADDV